MSTRSDEYDLVPSRSSALPVQLFVVLGLDDEGTSKEHPAIEDVRNRPCVIAIVLAPARLLLSG